MKYLIIPLFAGLILTLAIFGFIKRRNYRTNKKRLERSYKDDFSQIYKDNKPKTIMRPKGFDDQNNVIF